MPPAVVTLTSTVPVPAGEIAVICGRGVDGEAGAAVGAELHRGRSGEVGAGDDVTVVPPAAGPDVGASPVTVGRGDIGELIGRRCRRVPPALSP